MPKEEAEIEDGFSSGSSDSDEDEFNESGRRALMETERLATGLQKLQENMSARIESAVSQVRSQTMSTRENVKGIFVRIGDVETKNEVLDNAVAAIRFTLDSMKLWKQDIQTEIQQMRDSIPAVPEPYDDSKLQEQLEGLAKTTTTSLLKLENLDESKGKHEKAVKAALEEQASAIAHLVASKADQQMVQEGLNSKADGALEDSIRAFMRKVSLDIADRDYRSGKIASSERAQLETRILRMVTSSLRRIRRQQSTLSKALPHGPFGSQPSLMAGVVYKCLACERPSPPECLTSGTLSLLSGGSSLTGGHDFSNSRQSIATQASGSLTIKRPVTAPHSHGAMVSKRTALDLSADPALQARRNLHAYSPYKVKGAGF